MFNIITTIIIGIVAFAGNFFPSTKIWDAVSDKFGAVSYPTSLDSLVNPNGTDSVATVSHSAQHSNANDAIEALETKLGITGSTAVTGSILAGNGAGSSIWTTYGTTTNFTATNLFGTTLGTFGTLLSQGSSTIVGGLTITGNSTTTNATSTIGAFTSLATSTRYFGAGLSTCSGNNFLQWTGGSFNCTAPTGGSQVTSGISTSTGTQVFVSGISMAAGNTILLWATCGQSNAGTRAAIGIRPSNWATTTYADSTLNDKNTSVHTRYTATTTTTFSAQMNNTCDSWNSLMYQLVQ